jgi:hypothetical protein
MFIAECKFWHGKKGFLDTISQLLGYLTWRDSKAAVIMFVPNKDFTSVLETAKQVVSEHPNYLDFTNAKDETWLNYVFHLNDDRNRQVKIAIMFYHIPKLSANHSIQREPRHAAYFPLIAAAICRQYETPI